MLRWPSFAIVALTLSYPPFALGTDEYETALRLRAGEAGPANPATALASLKKACRAGHARACRELGAVNFFGDGAELNVLAATTAYQQGCDAGDGASCIMLAKVARRGFAGPTDTAKADKLLARACEIGTARDCVRAASMYSQQSHFLYLGSVSEGFENNEMLSTLASDACKRGYLGACGRGYSALRARVDEAKAACADGKVDNCMLAARAHADGQYAEKSLSKAADLYDLACRLGSVDGCYAAEIARAGENAKRADVVAVAAKYCVRGAGEACDSAGAFFAREYASKQNQAKAQSLLRRGCIADNAASCVRLADYIRERGVKAPYGALYERGCWLGEETGCNMVKAGSAVMDGVRYAQTCKTTDPAACAKAGVLFQRGDRVRQVATLFYVDYGGVKEDRPQAIALYRLGCDKKNGASCGLLGLAHFDGDVASKDLGKAKTFFSTGCDLADGFSCSMLGYLFDSGTGVDADTSRATALTEKGCELGASLGCRLAGLKYLKGEGVDQDSAKATTLLNRGCELKDDTCCRERSSFKSDADVFARLKRECEKGKMGSCFTLGERYRDGTGVDRNRQEALGLFRRLCDMSKAGARDDIYSHEDGEACFNLVSLKDGVDFRSPQPEERGLLERSCSKQFGLACTITQCESGDAESCAKAGDAFRNGSFAVKGRTTDIRKDVRLAESFYSWGCEQSDGAVCFAVGEMSRTGAASHDWMNVFDERRKNLPFAAKMYVAGCEKGNAKACSAAGDMNRNGSGVPASSARARELYKKACDLGLGDACVGLKLLN